MDRTFSLKRLLLNVALFALLSGFITAFPVGALQIALPLSIFLPALIISAVFAYCSRQPKAVFATSLIGTGIGWSLSPTLFVSWAEPPTWWEYYLVDLQTQALPTIVGATLLGGIALVVSRLPHGHRKVR